MVIDMAQWRWGWGPWPGKGPWSYLPPWQRPGWYYGRGWCWYWYWNYLSQTGQLPQTPPPPTPPIPPYPVAPVKPEDELKTLEEYKRELLEELRSIEARIEELRKMLKKE